MSILDYQHYYLVGIKGVAMTALAQMLVDAGKHVRGSDVSEKFVTQEILDELNVTIDIGFDSLLPPDTDVVIFTSAHQANDNTQVQAAIHQRLPIVTQAEAIAELFNMQQGIAVCGVGGKSTTSAMIAWVLEKLNLYPSYFVGVGNIPGIGRTGKWNSTAQYFVAEADEYVTNPRARELGEEIVPKFSFMRPHVTACTNLRFDHPDVYRDFEHTKQVYGAFFANTHREGTLIINQHDFAAVQTMPQYQQLQKLSLMQFGEHIDQGLSLETYESNHGQTLSTLKFENQAYQLTLAIPGKYNVMNALAALLACHAIGIDIQQAADTLSSFRSTKRRFEFIGEKNGVRYYDDYAHHPHEVKSVIQALNEWYPTERKVIAFQSHTFTRTRELFSEFVDSFSQAQKVVMIDIFSSAREMYDSTMTSDKLCAAISTAHGIPARNVKTIEKLASFCRDELKPGDVFITVGAGDIYEVHELLD